jgi:hypothetical protein
VFTSKEQKMTLNMFSYIKHKDLKKTVRWVVSEIADDTSTSRTSVSMKRIMYL